MTETAHTPLPELLPCPFCGSPAEIEEGSDHHGTWFNLGCSRHWGHVRNPDHTNTCIAGRIYYTETDVPLAEALTAWNTRADSHHRLVEARDALRAFHDGMLSRSETIAKIDAALKEAGR